MIRLFAAVASTEMRVFSCLRGLEPTPAARTGQAVDTGSVMEIRARLFAFAVGIAVLLFVINLVRTRKLKEEFALLWLLTAVVLTLAPLVVDYLDLVARALGIEYPPAFIFVLAIISLLLVLFQFSVRISRFSDQIKVLTQEVALLRARIEDVEHAHEDSESQIDGESSREAKRLRT